MRRKGFFEYKQFTIDQRHAGMKVGTDADLLGTLSAGGSRILDIGTGTGVLSLMLAQRCPEAEITALEMDENAILDATTNFSASAFGSRITLHPIPFQEYLAQQQAMNLNAQFDCIICNPPYFDKSLENPDISRMRARHTSSLPFEVLISGAAYLLQENGVFSVCIPGEVLDDFRTLCFRKGFWLRDLYRIRTVPEQEPKRFVLVHQKGQTQHHQTHDCCMLNADRTRSAWYLDLMKDFHL